MKKDTKKVSQILCERFGIPNAFDADGRLSTEGWYALRHLYVLIKDLEGLKCVPKGSATMCENQMNEIIK